MGDVITRLFTAFQEFYFRYDFVWHLQASLFNTIFLRFLQGIVGYVYTYSWGCDSQLEETYPQQLFLRQNEQGASHPKTIEMDLAWVVQSAAHAAAAML